MYIPQVDLHHIYGEDLERQHKLRLFKDGKLKYQVQFYFHVINITKNVYHELDYVKYC